MHHILENISQTTGDELIDSIKSIPTGVTALTLHNVGFNNKTVAELVLVLKSLPPTVTELHLPWSSIERRGGEELSKIFSALPSHITLLNLAGNSLSNLPANELAQVFKAIPTSVNHLILTYNGIGHMSLNDLVQIFTALPPGISRLDLSTNFLSLKRSSDDLAKILQALHSGITQLTLDDNGLGEIDDLALAFSGLSRRITSLGLRANNLAFKKYPNYLYQAFRALPDFLTHLGLRQNGLHELSVKHLHHLRNTLPGVHTISFSESELSQMSLQQINKLKRIAFDRKDIIIKDDNGITLGGNNVDARRYHAYKYGFFDYPPKSFASLEEPTAEKDRIIKNDEEETLASSDAALPRHSANQYRLFNHQPISSNVTLKSTTNTEICAEVEEFSNKFN